MNRNTQDKIAEKASDKLWQAGGKAVGLGSITSSIVGQVLTPTMLGDGDVRSPAENKAINDRAKQNSQSSSMWSQSDVGTTKLDLAANLHRKGYNYKK
jgi:hypothetical protein